MTRSTSCFFHPITLRFFLPRVPNIWGWKSWKKHLIPAWVGCLLLFTFPALPAATQSLEGLVGDSNVPVEIYADEGIEWLQEKQVYIARGKARAVRGGVTLDADVLTAHYRSTGESGTDIWRLDADSNVTIRDSSSVIHADRGIFYVAKGILVLTGRNLRLETGKSVVTARDSMEYWQLKDMAVARGNARVVNENRRIDADVLTAYFHKVPGKGSGLQRVEAFGDVKIKTPKETITSEKGNYDTVTGIVSISGSVEILRDGDQLAGEYGEVNLNTDVSRLLGAPPGGSKKGRVRGVLSPKKETKIEPKKTTPPQ
ncbi:MAG TPA: LptA/OstA family protein [Alphaproteobacteria bacterium]|nr:LptA/OstA family protein [Alphaproteobacteria bacterium]